MWVIAAYYNAAWGGSQSESFIRSFGLYFHSRAGWLAKNALTLLAIEFESGGIGRRLMQIRADSSFVCEDLRESASK
jgi:hypothetical protein